MRRAGVGLADGVCGRGAGNRAKTCPEGGAGPEPARQYIVLLISPPEERRFGSRRAQPQKMLLKSFITENEGEWPPPQPGSLLAAVIKERKKCSAEKPVI